MTKKLLPTMIGAALVAGVSAASADVTVFGHIDTAIASSDSEISATDSSGGSFSSSADDINLVCTTCSIGFKGSEDLGNGLKAIFSLDFEYDTTTRNKNITDRDQWVGLAGGFGKVRIGTISTPYKSTGAMIDPLYRTVLQGRDWGLQSSAHSGAGEELEGRATNTFRWDSADFSGVKLAAHYTMDSTEDDAPAGSGPEDENDNPYGIGASYSNGGVMVFANFQDNGQGGTGEENAWKIGGKFGMDNIAVMGQYEELESGAADLEVWHIAGSYTAGNNMIYAAFGQGDGSYSEGGVSATGEYDVFTIAATHSLSKRTTAYAGYSNIDGDGAGVAGGITGTVSGEDETFALGLKHKF